MRWTRLTSTVLNAAWEMHCTAGYSGRGKFKEEAVRGCPLSGTAAAADRRRDSVLAAGRLVTRIVGSSPRGNDRGTLPQRGGNVVVPLADLLLLLPGLHFPLVVSFCLA